MPHKHKRKRDEAQVADFDLPPSSRAAPLPVHRPKAVVTLEDGENKRSNKRRKPNKSANSSAQQGKVVDDTPKQFARLMAFQNEGKKLRKGLDDGVAAPKQKKTKKASSNETAEAAAPASAADAPTTSDERGSLKILPNERLADFSLRVDQTLPLSSVPRHGTKPTQTVPGVKEKTYLTKHNKRLARMQSQWREDEKRLQDKRKDEEEELDDQKEEEGLLWMDVDEARKGKKGKKSKREGDIWKALDKRRKDEGRLGGLNAANAVQAPPVLKRVKNMFKERPMGRIGVGVTG